MMILKQAENGLQSRSSENGKRAVWHYGLKLHELDYHEGEGGSRLAWMTGMDDWHG